MLRGNCLHGLDSVCDAIDSSTVVEWVPWVDFLEVNVRTYVKWDDRPGDYVRSLDANSVMAVIEARMRWTLPYHSAQINMRSDQGKTSYSSSEVS